MPLQEVALVVMFVATAYAVVITAMLVSEFIEVVRQPATPRERHRGLSSSEIASLFRWAPAVYKKGPLVAILVVMATTFAFFLAFGQISTSGFYAGVMLYFTAFALLAMPVAGSAVRMSGSYQDNASLLRADGPYPIY